VPFEDVMTTVSRWLVATEALAAVGAELTLSEAPEPGHPDVARALHAVSAAAGLPALGELPPPQRQMVTGLIRMVLRQAQDLLDNPGRAPGWVYTDPDILQGWGRGSAVVPGALAASAPELAGVRSFLDVGTGIGLLAIAAARTWPEATVTGIDVWAPALKVAADNIRAAGLGDRITLRDQDVTIIDEKDAYDCVWFPTFFVTGQVLDAAVPRLVRSLRPDGWLVLGRMASPPDPLAEATTTLRIIRGGGADFDAKRLTAALEGAGCASVRVLPRQGPAPLEYVIGQRPGG
jgi:SAM-dependent methyltransferase